jgi:hypothetical protein
MIKEELVTFVPFLKSPVRWTFPGGVCPVSVFTAVLPGTLPRLWRYPATMKISDSQYG